MLKDAFQAWATANGFRVISRSADTAVGTAQLLKRRGAYVVETHPALAPAKLEHYKELGVDQDYAVVYPFGVKPLSEADLTQRLRAGC